MYKIIQTTEKGKPQLSVVPDAWEREGILFWPKNKADKLMKDANSTPTESWFQMQCSVKRTNLITLDAAEKELNKMLLCDDTDDCEPVVIPVIQTKKRPKVHLPKTSTQNNDFNNIAQSCMKSSTASNSTIPAVQNITLSLEAQQQQTFNETSESLNSYNLVLNSTPAPEPLEIQRRPRVHLPKTTAAQNDFNNIAQSCMKPTSNPTIASIQNITLPLEAQQQQKFNLASESLNSYNLVLNSTPAPEPLEIQDFSFQIPSFDTKNIEKILKNQEEILNNQQIIFNQLSTNSVLLEEFFKKFETHGNFQSGNSLINSKVDSFLKDFKPIDSLQDMNELESKLKHADTRNMLVEKLSFICGKSGKEHGLNTCYTIVDNLFTRKFMTLCSWAGGSRKDKEKIPFKIYKNVILFFFTLVKLADNDFTLENCENFFKNILKNSTRRNEIKHFARSSKVKNRPKNLKYKTKETEIVENNYNGSQKSTLTNENNNNGSQESTSTTENNEEIADGEESDSSTGSGLQSKN